MADRYLLNGQPVSGFSRDADSIDYDNTGTGLSSTDVQGAITEINSNLSDVHPIGVAHLAGTTDAYGIFNITTDGKPVIYAVDANSSSICFVGRSGNIQWVKVVDYALSPVANTAVDIYYYYLEPIK